MRRGYGSTGSKPLLTWLLRDSSGKAVAEEPYESGLFDLLEAYTPMRDLLVEQIQSLSEDAQVVAEDTQRRWIVPIEELIGPLKAPALPWGDE